MRMMMTGAAFAALMLAACNPNANAPKPGDPDSAVSSGRLWVPGQ